jgi:hypothetical protein
VAETIDYVALLSLALMTGNEICVALFVEPVLRGLPETAQIASSPRFAGRLGKGMPAWYALSLLLDLAAWWMSRGSERSVMFGIAAGLQALIVVTTILVLVPINNRLAAMNSAYAGWQRDAQRWDALHRARVVLLLAATIFVTVAITR